MYLLLKDFCFYFESINSSHSDYLNIIDYKVYSEKEKLFATLSDNYDNKDFVLINKINREDIVKKFLVFKNNHKLLRRENKSSFSVFHRYIEDNRLVDEWNEFEKKELINYAILWCNNNGINYSLK